MTTVGSMAGDLASNNEARRKSSINDDKVEKSTVAPINGNSPMLFIQGCSKLDMEPNPFEQSFAGTGGSNEGTVETSKCMLPPIGAMSGRLAPGSDQFGWDAQSLRMGPLSPSMLEGPQNPIVFDEKTTQNPVAIGPFPSSTASISTIFTSGAPIADSGLPFIGVPGPLPAPSVVIHSTESYQPVSFNPQQQQQHHQGQTQDSQLPRPSQNYGNPNNHPSINDRHLPPHQAQHPDNINGFNNLHLLSQQAQASHNREMWIKRESTDANGNTPQNSHPNPQSRPPPPVSGQNIPGMPGMVAAPQLPKNGVEPAFVRGVRRNRVTSDDQSDDSDSRHSGNSDGAPNSKKKPNTGDEKMDEEEKRKNFLERNRQAALKCRQRKKQWLANLQQKVEYLTTDNEHLQNQTAMLRDEIIHLKALLLAHKDCPVAQANGVYAETIGMPNHNGVINHDINGFPIQHHQQGVPQQGRGQPRGPLPQPGPHHHSPIQGGPRMGGQPIPPPTAIVGPMASSTGRPMSMMQDITPSASPSQGQANVRY